jgi:hypothetical protein
MSQPKTTLRDTATRLQKQIAAKEAELTELKYRLAKTAAKLDGTPPPVSGLEMLWNEALPTARSRSSKIQCRTAWERIPKDERPTITQALAALKTWNRSEEWRKDGNAYVPGLDKWIARRQWENLPEVLRVDPSARYRPTPKPAPEPSDPDDEITDPEEIKRFLGIIK